MAYFVEEGAQTLAGNDAVDTAVEVVAEEDIPEKEGEGILEAVRQIVAVDRPERVVMMMMMMGKNYEHFEMMGLDALTGLQDEASLNLLSEAKALMQ